LGNFLINVFSQFPEYRMGDNGVNFTLSMSLDYFFGIWGTIKSGKPNVGVDKDVHDCLFLAINLSI